VGSLTQIMTRKIVKMLELNRRLRSEGKQVLHPCLIARSGTGKSQTVATIARQMNLELQKILLQTMMEYEVIGIPKVIGKQVEFILSKYLINASRRPYLIFFDEIDKPRPDVISAILTLLSDFRVMGINLHPRTLFMIAGQEAPSTDDTTLEALRRRIIILPVKWWHDPNFLERKYNIDLSFYRDLCSPEVDIEKIFPSEREIEYLINLYDSGIFSEKEFEELLLYNYKVEFVQGFMNSLKNRVVFKEGRKSPFILRVDSLCYDPDPLKKMFVTDILALSSDLEVMDSLDADALSMILPFFLIMTKDEAKQFSKNIFSYVHAHRYRDGRLFSSNFPYWYARDYDWEKEFDKIEGGKKVKKAIENATKGIISYFRWKNRLTPDNEEKLTEFFVERVTSILHKEIGKWADSLNDIPPPTKKDVEGIIDEIYEDVILPQYGDLYDESDYYLSQI